MDISAVGDNTVVDQHDHAVETTQKEPEVPVEPQVTTKPGETEAKLKAEETVSRASVPNLRKVDSPVTPKAEYSVGDFTRQYPTWKKSFENNLDALKKTGESIPTFIAELKTCIRDKNSPMSFDGEQGELKKATAEDYIKLVGTADLLAKEASVSPHVKYTSPYLQIYELQEANGFPFFGREFLMIKQGQAYMEIGSSKLKGVVGSLDLYRMQDFTYDVALPGFARMLQHLETMNNTEDTRKLVVSTIVDVYLDPGFQQVFPAPKGYDTLSVFFPSIVKYSSLDKIKGYINERYKTLPEWERTYVWIDLLCQAAEMLAPTNPEAAQRYLKKAEKEVEDQLWAYPFSPNRAPIEQTRTTALDRIANAKKSL